MAYNVSIAGYNMVKYSFLRDHPEFLTGVGVGDLSRGPCQKLIPPPSEKSSKLSTPPSEKSSKISTPPSISWHAKLDNAMFCVLSKKETYKNSIKYKDNWHYWHFPTVSWYFCPDFWFGNMNTWYFRGIWWRSRRKFSRLLFFISVYNRKSCQKLIPPPQKCCQKLIPPP